MPAKMVWMFPPLPIINYTAIVPLSQDFLNYRLTVAKYVAIRALMGVTYGNHYMLTC